MSLPTCDDHDAEIRETLIEAGETIVGEVPIVAAIDDEPVTAAGDIAPEVVGPERDGEIPLRFPVLVIEAADTSDGRFLEAGSLTHRALPIPLLAQPESAHGGDDAGPAGVVGRIDTLTRTPGPEVVSPRTGEPFPDGTFVWSATGVLSSTARVGEFDVADLFRRRFLRGVSVDLAGMDYEVIGGEDGMAADPEFPRRQMIAHAAEIAAATLVVVPAFSDAYAEIATDDTPAENMPADMPATDPTELGLAASAFPAWRSAEVGDYPADVVAAFDRVRTARGVKWYQLPIGALIRRKKPGAKNGAARGQTEAGNTRAMTDRDRAAVNAAAESFSPVRLRTIEDIQAFFTDEKNVPVVTDRQASAVNDYTSVGFTAINSALRSGRTPSARVRDIDAAMTPTKQDLSVWRIVRPDALGLNSRTLDTSMPGMKGRVLTDKAFMSTSIAADRDKNTKNDLHPVRLHVAVPKGSPALIAAPLSDWPAERELLLPRSTSVAITRTKKRADGSGWDVYGVVVPTDRAGRTTS